MIDRLAVCLQTDSNLVRSLGALLELLSAEVSKHDAYLATQLLSR